jgi:hypothetical protein
VVGPAVRPVGSLPAGLKTDLHQKLQGPFTENHENKKKTDRFFLYEFRFFNLVEIEIQVTG